MPLLSRYWCATLNDRDAAIHDQGWPVAVVPLVSDRPTNRVSVWPSAQLMFSVKVSRVPGSLTFPVRVVTAFSEMGVAERPMTVGATLRTRTAWLVEPLPPSS